MEISLEKQSSAWSRLIHGSYSLAGSEYFDFIVKGLCEALNVHAAMIATYDHRSEILSAISFYLDGQYVENYSFKAAGTVCEILWMNEDLAHLPTVEIDLFPKADPPPGCVSYLGLPVKKEGGKVVAQLTILDNKRMEADPKVLSLLYFLSKRVLAELERIGWDRLDPYKVIGEHSVSMVHDLKSNVEGLAYLTSTLSETDAVSIALRDSLNIMREQLLGVLEYSQNREPQRTKTEGRTLLERACRKWQIIFSRAERVFEWTCPDGLWLNVDERCFERILSNLIWNAYRVLPPSGFVRIELSEDESHSIIDVIDNGPGISEEITEKLYQPFLSLKGHGNFGLGLTIVYNLVMSHAGRIMRQPTSSGTCFRILLPKNLT